MANTSTLKKIVAEAKRIQKAHPHMEWKNAIKDASKHIKEGAKTVIKKKTTKKGVGYADDRIELLRKTTPILRKLKNEGLTRTKAIKKINKTAKSISGIMDSNDIKKAFAKKYVEELEKLKTIEAMYNKLIHNKGAYVAEHGTKEYMKRKAQLKYYVDHSKFIIASCKKNM